jgi:hypothetical protein
VDAPRRLIEIPGGLHDSTRRPRHLRVVSNGSWFLAGEGTLAKVGFGELGMADLRAVQKDLGERVFLAHPEARPIEAYLRGPARFAKRLRWFESLSSLPEPSLAAVARGAQLAVLPESGVVWVDDERVFRAGETVPLPWTKPTVELLVVRPRTVMAAMRRVIGPAGPKRVQPAEEPA